MKALEQIFCFGAGLSLDGGGHQRGRCLGDGAPLSLEAHVDDGVVLELDPERQRVAAQRIPALNGATRIGHLSKVARLSIVLEDELLVEGFGGHDYRLTRTA